MSERTVGAMPRRDRPDATSPIGWIHSGRDDVTGLARDREATDNRAAALVLLVSLLALGWLAVYSNVRVGLPANLNAPSRAAAGAGATPSDRPRTSGVNGQAGIPRSDIGDETGMAGSDRTMEVVRPDEHGHTPDLEPDTGHQPLFDPLRGVGILPSVRMHPRHLPLRSPPAVRNRDE